MSIQVGWGPFQVIVDPSWSATIRVDTGLGGIFGRCRANSSRTHSSWPMSMSIQASLNQCQVELAYADVELSQVGPISGRCRAQLARASVELSWPRPLSNRVDSERCRSEGDVWPSGTDRF